MTADGCSEGRVIHPSRLQEDPGMASSALLQSITDPEVQVAFAEPEERYQSTHILSTVPNKKTQQNSTKIGPRMSRNTTTTSSRLSASNLQISESCKSKNKFENDRIKRPKSLDRNSYINLFNRNLSIRPETSTPDGRKTTASPKSIITNKNINTSMELKNVENVNTQQVQTFNNSHSGNCPRNPQNLSLAHKHHNKDKSLSNKNNSSSNNNTMHSSRFTSKNNESELVRNGHRDISNASTSKHSQNVLNDRLTCSCFSDTHQKRLSVAQTNSRTHNITCSKNIFINKYNKQANTRRNGYNVQSFSRSPCPMKSELTNSSNESRSRPKTRNKTNQPELNHFSRPTRKDLTINNDDKIKNQKRRSESTARYVIPQEVKPIRSKSNLGEFHINKSELKSNYEQNNIKLNMIDHIYDTIESCGCHKYAIDRIDSFLIHQKSALEISANNYDVPKPTRLNLSKCPHITHKKIDLHNHEKIITRENLNFFESSTNKKAFHQSEPKSSQSYKTSVTVNNTVSDTDSTATYATINLPEDMNILHLEKGDETKRIPTPTKIRTLDIKEEKRRTPDIVKCSRESRALKNVPVVNHQEKRVDSCHCKTFYNSTKSSNSSDKDSETYHDVSPPSTVIHIPIKSTVQNHYIKSKFIESGEHNFVGDSKSVDKNNDKNYIGNDDEIYSVVDEWPSDDITNDNAHANDYNKVHKIHSTFEIPEFRMDTFSNKYTGDSSEISTLDPLRVRYSGNEAVSNSSEHKCCLAQSHDQCSKRGTINKTPQVTICKSVEELCTLVSSDPTAHVYVYQATSSNDSNHSSSNLTSARPNEDDSQPAMTTQSGRTATIATSLQEVGSLPSGQDKKSPVKGIKGVKTEVRDMKKSILQRLRRVPTTKSKENKLNTAKSKNLRPLSADVSRGVTFVEPNYEHQNASLFNEQAKKESLRFDYSSSWQNLRHLKQLTIDT